MRGVGVALVLYGLEACLIVPRLGRNHRESQRKTTAMPVPTDTLWNIKRLNVIFAASAILLVAIIGWTIVQDYGAAWRQRQENGRVWEAALVDQKIHREL